jgi:hypothetical protein
MSRFHKLERELSAQILEAHTRKLRLEKQHRVILIKLRITEDRKAQNIFKLKVNKMLSKRDKQFSTPKTLNSPSF